MLTSYLRIAWRHLTRHKIFTTINILGMTAGLASFALIAQYIDYELQFDRYHASAEDIVRVTYQKRQNGEVTRSSATTFFGVGDFAKQNLPEVKNFVRFYKWPAQTGAILAAGGHAFNEKSYLFAGTEFFLVFNSLLKQGNPAECLKDPNSVVLSERLALKMFGTTDVLGKFVERLDRKGAMLKVTGIMRNLPENSHFDADVIIPWDVEWKVEQKDHWKFPSHWTYMRLVPGTDVKSFEMKLNELVLKEQRNNPDVGGTYLPVKPIADIHLFSHENDEIKVNGSIITVYVLGLAAIAILIISWINYVNLESARFTTRIREVGVRRYIGAPRSKLVMQFFVQYVLVSVPSIMLAGIVVFSAQPAYQRIIGISLSVPELSSPPWILAMGIVALGMAIAGLYPSMALARVNTIQSLKGKISSTGNATPRRLLLTFQFSISMVLVALLLVITDQLDFMRRSDQLDDLSRVVSVYNPTVYAYTEDSLRKEKYDVFYNILTSKRSIERAAASSAIPGEAVGFTYQNLLKRSLSDPDDGRDYKVIFADEEFIPVYRLNLLAGRYYDRKNGDDVNQNTIILNESAIHSLGFTSAAEALDKEVYFMVTWDWKKYRIIGITEDYHHESIKQAVIPTIFYYNVRKFQMVFYSIRLSKEASVDEAIADIRTAWEEVWPEKAFNYAFMDQRFDQQYKSEVRLSSIFRLFSVMVVLLASLGIIGLTIFEVHARIREIGIRKTLGATAAGLVTMLTKSYITVTALATLVAVPVTYWAATVWLEEYPVRIGLQVAYFALPVLLLVGLVVLSSGLQTYRAASANPVEALRHE